ncbi:MAG TPA: hypothetical protein VJ201_09080 [Candidatus Babeliales bacterium]|nr:hypothetical protein [Candidatus Babeliales bacterium]
MNILDKRCQNLKREFFSVIFLSLIQIWWCFNFPAFMRAEYPWRLILSFSTSIISIAGILFLFMFIDQIAPVIKLEHIDSSPNPSLSKIIYIMACITAAFLALFFAWYKDLYGMSNTHYALFYFTWLIIYILVYRAAYRIES